MTNMESIVNSIVTGVVSGLQAKVVSLEEDMKCLKDANQSLVKRVSHLESVCDEAEQYSRRLNLRISGLNETADENTEAKVLEVCKSLNADFKPRDIDRSHRVGRPPNNTHRPLTRPVIVRFTSYKARQAIFKGRSKLKTSQFRGVFLNEDLTKTRDNLLYQARRLLKNRQLNGAWSYDGSILIKDLHNKVIRISSAQDLDPFKLPSSE